MKTTTKNKMVAYAKTLPPSTVRAQCHTIANLVIGRHGTIANALDAAHRSTDGAQRAAKLMVEAGCATEKTADPCCFGVFTFEDGSQL